LYAFYPCAKIPYTGWNSVNCRYVLSFIITINIRNLLHRQKFSSHGLREEVLAAAIPQNSNISFGSSALSLDNKNCDFVFEGINAY